MNWYKKIKIAEWYSEEDIEENINAILEEELKHYGPLEKLEIIEKLQNILAKFPPGYKVKKEWDGWSIATPEGKIVSFNEKDLEHAIPGGKARLDFMGQTL